MFDKVPWSATEGFRGDIWNLPARGVDDRWGLFNYIIETFFKDNKLAYTSNNRCRFLEIGVWKASNVAKMFDHFGSIFNYVGVDPYGLLKDDPYKGLFWDSDAESEAVYQSSQVVFDHYGATLCRQSSDQFFAQDDREFDIVFVDGDHRHLGALTDCRNGFKKLRSGGLLIVDDYGNNFHPEVEWAVRDFEREHRQSIARSGAMPLFFELEGMAAPIMLMFTYFQKK